MPPFCSSGHAAGRPAGSHCGRTLSMSAQDSVAEAPYAWVDPRPTLGAAPGSKREHGGASLSREVSQMPSADPIVHVSHAGAEANVTSGRTRRFVPLAASLLLATMGHAPARADDDPRGTIEHQYAQMSLALERNDLGGYFAFFNDGARMVDAYGLEKSVAETAAAYAALFASQNKASDRYGIRTVAVSGGEAIVDATSAMAGEMVVSGAQYRVRSEGAERDTWILTNGEWKIARSQELANKLWFGDTLVVDRTVDEPLAAQERAAVLAELRARAVAIASVEAGSGSADLDAIGSMIGDARIVALGEATHGTAEIFKMKRRLVQYLVERKGFTVLGIESDWPDVRAVDRYVRTGEGSADDAARAIGNPWATQEVRDMLAWMRSYNERRGDRTPLSVFGFDMQYPGEAAKCVVDLVGRAGSAARADAMLLYEGIDGFGRASDQEIARLRSQALRVDDLLDKRRDELAKVLNPAEQLELSRCVRHVAQAFALRASSSPTLRDEMMADNARRLIEESYSGQKVILWAHSGHLSMWPGPSGSNVTMGTRLHDRFGSQMFVVGFGFAKGEVRARRLKGGTPIDPGQWTSLTLSPPVPYSADAFLAAADLPRFALDLRRAQADGGLGRWLSRDHWFRTLGWGYDPDSPTFGYEKIDLAAAYDALVFIAESSAAKPLADPTDAPR
jgi:erythromycin esterase